MWEIRWCRAGGRYYRPSSVKCLNCNEVGHLSKDCPRPKKSQICIFCGYTGHFYRNCPQSLCYNCNQPGHTARLCEAPRQKRHWTCFRCDMLGHSHENCTDHWRQFHLTTSVKQPCPVRGQSDLTNKRTFCYNCGGSKHYGFVSLARVVRPLISLNLRDACLHILMHPDYRNARVVQQDVLKQMWVQTVQSGESKDGERKQMKI
ncbi:zinc finger CCHC domain-containing protein 7-like [Haliotis rubra]|uniref:zinc finger CCHC domain-containing protein 7-like n=1 Tax=Haliotis rubra TaxID=36100 RepID=UPI001EE5E278|nr:zinc finger CCHC domain-containing protein 7-like [Haliotis rubra]